MAVCGVMLYFCTLPFTSFFTYGDRPYPPLPPAMSALFTARDARTPSRMLGLGQDRSELPGYVFNLQHNFPTVYRLYSVTGYDPLVMELPETQAVAKRLDTDFYHACQKYGIRWIVTARSAHPTDEDEQSIAEARSADYEYTVRRMPGAKLALTLLDYRVWELAQPDPFAFPSTDPSTALPITVNGQGVTVDLSAHPTRGAIIVNFTRRPWMAAFLDGKPIAMGSDPWGRILVNDIPGGAHALSVKYLPPWHLGFLAALLLALCAAGVWGLAVGVQRREDARKFDTVKHCQL